MKSIAAIHKEYGKPTDVLHPETIEVPNPKKGKPWLSSKGLL